VADVETQEEIARLDVRHRISSRPIMGESSRDLIDLEIFRAAKEARHFEINLFWQRSNYFLVLSTAIAAGFFSLREVRYALPLAFLGFFVGLLWVAMNLGSRFWHARWQHRVCIAEEKLGGDINLFSASWDSIEDDVRQRFRVCVSTCHGA
jgi:hypothetical protein